jgi:hypothetical protein
MEGNLHFVALIVYVDEKAETAMSRTRGEGDRMPIQSDWQARTIAAARNFDI